MRNYGGRGRDWDKQFLEYMLSIVKHPSFEGIPGAFDDDGRIDWIIPSNRKEGSKNWDGNVKRREWWRKKAEELSIPQEGRWLSVTARALHPFKRKPCQTCGRWMSIYYEYPNAHCRKALHKAFPDYPFAWNDYLTIFEIAAALKSAYGEETAIKGLLSVFPGKVEDPIGHWRALLDHLEARVNQADRKLSPGAMSNCPDRLDGFHTYNLCCRAKEDTGRGKDNMSRYVVDRRAYEHWAEGEWDVADLVMQAAGMGWCDSVSNCESKGELVQLSGDHIGPISLGFKHSPFFAPLCIPCNSSKNNRMAYRDIQMLLEIEAQGVSVMSWQGRYLWDSVKNLVLDDNDALLLSRLLRINQDAFMRCLLVAAESDHPESLLQFLSLHLAAERIVGLNVNPRTLKVSSYSRERRQDAYTSMRLKRIIRLAFTALADYAKGDRNVHGVANSLIDQDLAKYREELARCATPNEAIRDVREAIKYLVATGDDSLLEDAVDEHLNAILDQEWSPYGGVKSAIEGVMTDIQEQLVGRYRRGDHRRPEWSVE